MPVIYTPTATTSASAAVAVNTVVRDGGITEAMQLMNIADGVTGQTATVSASALNVAVQSSPIDGNVTGTITAADTIVAAPGGTGQFVTGNSTAGSYVAIQTPAGNSAWIAAITNLPSASGTLYFEESADSTNGMNGNWISVNGRQTGLTNTYNATSVTASGYYRGNIAGAAWFRVRATSLTSGVTPTVVIRTAAGTGATFFNASLPKGSNNIGSVQIVDPTGVNTASVSASGTFKPLSQANSVAIYNQLLTGTPTYLSGASGTVNVSGRVIGLSVYASSSGAYFTINGGSTINIPTNGTITINPLGNLMNPTLIFTSTTLYIIEVLN